MEDKKITNQEKLESLDTFCCHTTSVLAFKKFTLNKKELNVYLTCFVWFLPFYINQLNPGDKSALLFLNGNECHPLEELLMALKLADIVIHSLIYL